MRDFFVFWLLICTMVLYAQKDTTGKFLVSGYAEVYYSYDFSKPKIQEKPNFIYNYKRHNQLNINLMLVKADYVSPYFRAHLGVMAGNYAQYNLSAEPTWAQFIYEANMGVKLSKRYKVWLDIGIMPSHLGFESAIGADCFTLTRSLAAENSPYYETGLKLSYVSKNEQLSISFLALNGWQRIRKPYDIESPSFGIQLSYKPTEKISVNYNNFIGTDKPDSINGIRHFHNLYMQYEPTPKTSIVAGIDIGSDKTKSQKYGLWYTPVLIVRQKINPHIYLAFRGEYYYDKQQIIVATNTQNGFQTFGVSTNMDYHISQKVLFRIEGKMYYAKDKIFDNHGYNYALTTSIAVKL